MQQWISVKVILSQYLEIITNVIIANVTIAKQANTKVSIWFSSRNCTVYDNFLAFLTLMSEHMVNSTKLIFALEIAPDGTCDGFVMQLDMYHIDAN